MLSHFHRAPVKLIIALAGSLSLLLLLQDSAESVLKRMRNADMVDRIFSKDMFSAEFTNVLSTTHDLSESDIEILLTFLKRDKKALLYDGQVRSICVRVHI